MLSHVGVKKQEQNSWCVSAYASLVHDSWRVSAYAGLSHGWNTSTVLFPYYTPTSFSMKKVGFEPSWLWTLLTVVYQWLAEALSGAQVTSFEKNYRMAVLSVFDFISGPEGEEVICSFLTAYLKISKRPPTMLQDHCEATPFIWTDYVMRWYSLPKATCQLITACSNLDRGSAGGKTNAKRLPVVTMQQGNCSADSGDHSGHMDMPYLWNRIRSNFKDMLYAHLKW